MASPLVFPVSYRLKVIWIDAEFCAAEMIEFKACWHRTNEFLIHHPMGDPVMLAIS